MGLYYSDIQFEFEFSTGVWTDVSADVVGVVESEMGIDGNGVLDRVASPGEMKLMLLNTGNKYTPGHASCMSGFQVGVHCRLVLDYQTKTRTRYYGTVVADGIKVENQGWRPSYTKVTVKDFMEQAARHEMDLPAFAQNKTIEEVVPLITANMPVGPLATSLGSGQDTFPTVFDTTTAKTTALSEMAKVALSELGYIYAKQSAASDEVLAVEGRYTRATKTLAQVGVWGGASFSDTDAIFDNNMRNINLSHSDNYYNDIILTSFPRRVDATAVVLFNLEEPVYVAAGATINITGRYIDPTQEAESVAGINMIDPVATTDYLMNAADDGSGANLTADLTLTATYGTNGVGYEAENTGATGGYIFFLQARGYGVYTYRGVEYRVSDAVNMAADGRKTLSIQLKYQNNPLVAEDFAGVLLDLCNQKITEVESVTFVANRSEFLLNAFMDLQVGDKIRLIADRFTWDAEHFIHKIKFKIMPGGLVEYTLGLSRAYVSESYWLIGEVGYSEIGETTWLGY